ncbi:hypothetical protein [Ferruginibacter profundus]
MIATINQMLQNKLQSLVSFLGQVNKGFDAIAEEIDCSNLKTAMMAVAVESKQYAKEINDQLQQCNITVPVEDTDQLWRKIELNIQEQAGSAKGSEIVALCSTCETYFNKFYEAVLEENLPVKNLKAIITFQLYAIECAFMKIRLLNNLRFNS